MQKCREEKGKRKEIQKSIPKLHAASCSSWSDPRTFGPDNLKFHKAKSKIFPFFSDSSDVLKTQP